MPYERNWESTRPGCIILLLDQSGSMDDSFGGSQLGSGKKKSDMVATVLNNLLNEFVKVNSNGPEVKNRADIAVLGYKGQQVESALSGALSQAPFVNLSELIANPERVETRLKKEMDDTGSIVEAPVYFPIWVEPVANGGTPMCTALRRAKELAEQWVANHPDNYPPVVINVTDGAATDGDIAIPAQELRQVRTSDGETLLFNCHITDRSDPTIEFPGSEGELPNDPFAKALFDVSSTIPDVANNTIQTATGQTLKPNARGFIFNGDAASVRQMFVFATVAATQGALDPDR